ncbi:hypothetical protein HU200_051476 [Digitaria exilis]|uniref:Gnk2-homologous domain-containing protein n=1 Tax=Digitaria exilis TaxID=1010633 RepID=A0A835E6J7_9POAL|nr:hypothetical protein HU200_051476 [Digitaria exilis]
MMTRQRSDKRRFWRSRDTNRSGFRTTRPEPRNRSTTSPQVIDLKVRVVVDPLHAPLMGSTKIHGPKAKYRFWTPPSSDDSRHEVGEYPDCLYTVSRCRNGTDSSSCRACTTMALKEARRACPDHREFAFSNGNCTLQLYGVQFDDLNTMEIELDQRLLRIVRPYSHSKYRHDEVSRDATPHDPRERSAPTRCCNQEEAGRPKP